MVRNNRQAIEAQALTNATTQNSIANYGTIIAGFIERGIAAEDIKPRENVFTFNAWRALGRTVRKGEKGVKCVTFVKGDKVDAEGNAESYKFSRSVAVFHISQTEPLDSVKTH